MQSVVRSFSYADWSLRLGWGFNFVDIFNFSYSKPQCVVPISCVNVLYTVHSDSIIYFHYSGIYFRWKRRENCQITHLLCAVLWYSKSSPSSWNQCDLNPGRVKHIPTFEALCATVSSKFYFAMEFLLYLQTVLSAYHNRDYDASWARTQLIQVLFNPSVKSRTLERVSGWILRACDLH